MTCLEPSDTGRISSLVHSPGAQFLLDYLKVVLHWIINLSIQIDYIYFASLQKEIGMQSTLC